MPIISFVLALTLCIVLIPLVKRLSFKWGMVAQPRQDRWHQQATPVTGGIAILFAFLLALLIVTGITHTWNDIHWGMFIGSIIIFGIGLYDDYRPMSPQAKLIGQIIAATSVIVQGYTTDFFSPRIENQLVAQLPNILLTFVWLVGITNAINLLDNMDGLAGGISLITTLFLCFFFWREGDTQLVLITFSLAGSLLGFMVFNFPPASIFMGDSGSLFLGFTLAFLSIVRAPQASNVFAVLGVPTLLFLLPIIDTVLVTFTRLLRGQSPAQGGRDHTSHRLIALGLSERQTLMVLYAVAMISGVVAAALESIRYWFSLVLVPLLIIPLALISAYLGRIRLVASQNTIAQEKVWTRIMLDLTMRRRLLEVILDFFLIGVAFYLAFLTHFGGIMDEERLAQYLASLPLALGSAYISFFALGVYRGIWRYVGFSDLLRYILAALGSYVLLVATMFTFGSLGVFPGDQFYDPMIPFYFSVYLFLGLAASRSSFKILDQYAARRMHKGESKVLIVGAGDAGEMALRWIMMNPNLNYHPVGFIDQDPYMIGRLIHGVKVIGGLDKLEKILEKGDVTGVILAGVDPNSSDGQQIRLVCDRYECWVQNLLLKFQQLD